MSALDERIAYWSDHLRTAHSVGHVALGVVERMEDRDLALAWLIEWHRTVSAYQEHPGIEHHPSEEAS